MQINLEWVGESAKALMEKELRRIMNENERGFFTKDASSVFPFDKDAKHYLRCLTSYEQNGGTISPDFLYNMKHNEQHKKCAIEWHRHSVCLGYTPACDLDSSAILAA